MRVLRREEICVAKGYFGERVRVWQPMIHRAAVRATRARRGTQPNIHQASKGVAADDSPSCRAGHACPKRDAAEYSPSFEGRCSRCEHYASLRADSGEHYASLRADSGEHYASLRADSGEHYASLRADPGEHYASRASREGLQFREGRGSRGLVRREGGVRGGRRVEQRPGRRRHAVGRGRPEGRSFARQWC